MKFAFASLSRLLARAARDRQFTRREQLSIVMASHIGILGGALLIEWIFQLSSGIPIGFIIGEGLIIAAAMPFAVKLPWLADLWRLAAGPPALTHDSGDEAAQRDAAKKESVENLAGGVLIGASIVQFAALAMLLWGTGGPIESPFAEMTLMIAVFTPFIANQPKTIGSVVAASVIYYAIFILIYTNSHPKPDTIPEFKEALATPGPSVWAYFSVNVMILLGAIAFTIFESLVRSGEMSAATAPEDADASGSNGGGESNADPAASQEERRDFLASDDDMSDGTAQDGHGEDPLPTSEPH